MQLAASLPPSVKGKIMDVHLQQRVSELLQGYDRAILATCGPAGPQISMVPYAVKGLTIYLSLPHNSDLLFNLETNPVLALLTASWRLQGKGAVVKETVPFPHWQTIVIVTGTNLHVLDEQHTVETIDF